MTGRTERIAVLGLGYVGLPLLLAFARRFEGAVGYDVNQRRIEELRRGADATREVAPELLEETSARFTADPGELAGCSFFVVTVPTPIDANRQPDLAAIRKACSTIGPALRPGAVVVFESTVYPGLTEEVCRPLLEEASGQQGGADFKLGYSPERINPGDREHRLERITKIVAGEDGETLERVAAVYGAIIEAGIHRAPSIRVAEAAKVIENTQRDLNIALVNELALIFDRLGISTRDVLEAAATKWNFLPFKPGLVGGHCIGVDPYYLTAKAESVGYHPQVILAGRRINDGMGAYVAQKLVKLLIRADVPVRSARIGILGLTFKENVPDLRNSRVPDIVAELGQYDVQPLIHDPLADPAEARREYGLTLAPLAAFEALDGAVFAVPHAEYAAAIAEEGLLRRMLRPGGVLLDVKSAVPASAVPAGVRYWSL